MASGEPGVGVAAPLAAAPVLLDEVFVVAVEEAMAIFVSPKRRTLRARDGSGRKRGGHRLFNRGSINNFRAICRWRPSRGHSICGAKLVTGQSATMALPVVTNEKGHRSRPLASGMSNGATTNVVSSIWDVLIFFSRKWTCAPWDGWKWRDRQLGTNTSLPGPTAKHPSQEQSPSVSELQSHAWIKLGCRSLDIPFLPLGLIYVDVLQNVQFSYSLPTESFLVLGGFKLCHDALSHIQAGG